MYRDIVTWLKFHHKQAARIYIHRFCTDMYRFFQRGHVELDTEFDEVAKERKANVNQGKKM